MLKNLATALAAQRSIIQFLLARGPGATGWQADASLFRAIYAHLSVLEWVVVPFAPLNAASAKVTAGRGAVANEVAIFVKPSVAEKSLSGLMQSLAKLFADEAEMLQGMHDDAAVVDGALLERVEEYFLSSAASGEVSTSHNEGRF